MSLAAVDELFREDEGALWMAVSELAGGLAEDLDRRRLAGEALQGLAVLVGDTSLSEIEPEWSAEAHELGAAIVDITRVRHLVARLVGEGRAPAEWIARVASPASPRGLHALAVTRGRVALTELLFRLSSLRCAAAGMIVDPAAIEDEDVRDALLNHHTGLDHEELLEHVRQDKGAMLGRVLAAQAGAVNIITGASRAAEA